MIGTTLSHYRITEKLGAGGMGEVYRARDTKLNRDVALKVLPEAFAQDAGRMARFEREAQVLASLNHSNIASIYGLEESGGVRALVMELVEGETLAQRLAQGPIPLPESLEFARQIAEALEAAHEKGIIHRDLKPANIKITPEGKVKVLDFGLAKAYAGDATSVSGMAADLSRSPTLSQAGTAAGVILGTAGYMSPEQARGAAVDRRADIWAFGVVLFEMLTGKCLFAGDTVSDTLAAVLKSEPDWNLLPPGVPARLRDLLAHCLQRDPRRRLRDMGDALHELARAGEPQPAATKVRLSRAMLAAFAALGILTLSLASVLYWSLTRAPAPGETIYSSIALPEGHALFSSPAISSDGRTVVFASAGPSEMPRLYFARLTEDHDLHAIPDTEGANAPFFSPDGRSVAYFAKRKLFRVSLEGGTPLSPADAPFGYAGTWGENDSIVFRYGGDPDLSRVAATPGGRAETLIKSDRLKAYAQTYPRFLPNSADLLFTAWGEIGIVHFRASSNDLSIILPGFWTNAAYASSGHLIVGNISSLLKSQVFAIPGSIYTDKFGRTPKVVVDNVFADVLNGRMWFDLSDNGTLIYAAGDVSQNRLAMTDQTGHVSSTYGGPGYYETPSLSPNGERVAYTMSGRIYVLDLKGGEPVLLTTEAGAPDLWQDRWPTWNPDGSRVIYLSNRSGNWDIYAKDASGAGPSEPILTREGNQHEFSMRNDGTVVFVERDPVTDRDLWIRSLDGKLKKWLVTPHQETKPAFSPDGRLIAYQSDRNERFEIYISPFSNSQTQTRISRAGGTCPVWSPKGGRLFFRQGTSIMAVDIRGDGTPAGSPRPLFDGGWSLGTMAGLPLSPMNPSGFGFAVTGDEHFLMVQAEPEAVPTKINIVFNFFEKLKRLCPPGK